MAEESVLPSVSGKRALVLDRAGVPRPVLERALIEAGYSIAIAEPFQHGEPIRDQVLDAMRRADVVFIVLDDSWITAASLFESGMAFAMNKSIAIIDGRTNRDPTADSAVLDMFVPAPRMYVDLHNFAVVAEELDAFESAGQSSDDSLIPRTDWVSLPQREDVQNQGHFGIPYDDSGESKLAARLARVISRDGGHIVSTHSESGEPDLLIRFPGSELGDTVVVIELKRLSSSMDPPTEQLDEFLSRMRRPAIGVIVTENPGDELRSVQSIRTRALRPILVVGIKWLEANELGLRFAASQLRNDLVHGG